MTKVNLFVVGWPKCGTSIMWEYLNQNENIFLPKEKDIGFFSKDSKFKNINEYENKNYNFNKKNNYKYHCDISTNYIFSKDAPKKIHNYNKNAKIIIMIRNPADLLFSFYSHKKRSGLIKTTTFINWTKHENSQRFNSFSDKIENYLKYFDSKSLKIIIYENFKKNNQKEMNEIFDFLKTEKIKIEFKIINQNKSIRNKKILLITHYMRRKIKFIIKHLFSYSTRLKIGTFIEKIFFTTNKNKISQKDKETLMKRYKNDINKLNEILHNNNLVEKNFNIIKLWRNEKF